MHVSSIESRMSVHARPVYISWVLLSTTVDSSHVTDWYTQWKLSRNEKCFLCETHPLVGIIMDFK